MHRTINFNPDGGAKIYRVKEKCSLYIYVKKIFLLENFSFLYRKCHDISLHTCIQLHLSD